MSVPNMPPPRIVVWEPFADCEPMDAYPTGLRQEAEYHRRRAAWHQEQAFELAAMAREAELTGVPFRPNAA